jgi:pyruvate/2-oxoglutarate dehydrogenase complex dihydrolipoamide dehydrogenase (E3) component
MSTQRYDVLAVGGGAAGLVTAAGAAGLGARVALVERARLGGECLWTGCVPSKALLAAARAAAEARGARRYGVEAERVRIDFTRVMQWVHGAQQAIAPHDSPERFRALGVDVIEGTARFVAERVLEVDDRRITAKHIVVATGSRPAVPRIAGLDAVSYYTNETIFTIEQQPRQLLVIGCGPIGLELAQAFARLGTAVDIVELSRTLLPWEDAELAGRLGELVSAEGVRLHLGTRAERVHAAGDEIRVTIAGEDGARRELVADALLVAAGRRANVEDIDAAAGGIETSQAGVIVDDRLRTSARRTWAAGDVVAGAPRFTHVADYHARLVLRNALFPGRARVDYACVPWITYTDPELAHLGLTEAEAREQYGDRVRVFTRELAQLDRAIADGRTDGAVKIVADRRGRIVGAHVLGYGAGSVIAEIALAMRAGITLDRVAATVHAYPTYPEAFRQIGDAYNRTRIEGWKAGALRWLARRA